MLSSYMMIEQILTVGMAVATVATTAAFVPATTPSDIFQNKPNQWQFII